MFALARIVARCSHRASFSSSSPLSVYASWMSGRFEGRLAEDVLDDLDLSLCKCSLSDRRLFSPLGEPSGSLGREILRKRARERRGDEGDCAGRARRSSSGEKEGASSSSSVCVSLRMILNPGRGSKASRCCGSAYLVCSSICSFFLSRSRKGMLQRLRLCSHRRLCRKELDQAGLEHRDSRGASAVTIELRERTGSAGDHHSDMGALLRQLVEAVSQKLMQAVARRRSLLVPNLASPLPNNSRYGRQTRPVALPVTVHPSNVFYDQ